MKIAFYIFSPTSYSAELTYLYSLIVNIKNSLVSLQNHPNIIIYVSPENFSRFNEALCSFEFVTIVVSPLLVKNTLYYHLCRFLRKLTGVCLLESLLLLTHGVDLLSHNKLPFIFVRSYFWIPDLQMFELADNFTLLQRIIQFRSFSLGILLSSKVIVSSYYQKKSCINQFSLFSKSKDFIVLRFTAQRSSIVPSLPAEFSYLEGKNFIFLPNQWWTHKNHKLVIDTLNSYPTEDIPLIVCTGSLVDYRKRTLKQYIHTDTNLLVLGQVDYSFVLWLFENCIAVINPSLYEGWSSTVEEARLYLKPMILSSIPVHLEQNYPVSFYFNPSSVESLYSAICTFISSEVSPRDTSLIADSSALLNKDLRKKLSELYYQNVSS